MVAKGRLKPAPVKVRRKMIGRKVRPQLTERAEAGAEFFKATAPRSGRSDAERQGQAFAESVQIEQTTWGVLMSFGDPNQPRTSTKTKGPAFEAEFGNRRQRGHYTVLATRDFIARSK